MSSPVEELAGTLAALKHARDLSVSKKAERVLTKPKRLYPMSLVAAQLSINPFEFFMLVGILIVGLSYSLTGVAAPGSVQELLPPLWAYVWIGNLTLGSSCALIGGLYRRDVDKGLLVYQFGWGLVGIGTAIYGIAVMVAFPPSRGLYPGLSNLVFAVAAIVRVVQIQRFFRIADLMRQGLLRIPFLGPDGGGEHGDPRGG